MKISTALATLGFVAAATQVAVAKPLDPATTSALATIARDAKAVASGLYRGRSLQAPAREIGVAWYAAEKVLARDGDVLVETKMTNASITKFETDWQNEPLARAEAKEVASQVADLLVAARS